ncbi:MAG: DUF493 domain-containing protein [Gammaproteobacteria bacterium]|nr:DUF493 domain-containing protein [Gammaproteobacteria bacterium]NNF60761.1 DUF493 domain-containing protein [Gammaproteobacteria bacterium]NNM20228.1 DUF493 domain-containing protein [Gammaproteobacteria bacterium]
MTESLLEFPCRFPIKVMGRNTDAFRTTVEAIVRRHTPDDEFELRQRLSRDSNYLALSFTINATSQEQLDGLYRELSGSELVLFAL